MSGTRTEKHSVYRAVFRGQAELPSDPGGGQLAVSQSTGIVVGSLYSTLSRSLAVLKGVLGVKVGFQRVPVE